MVQRSTNTDILKIRDAVARAKHSGMNISEYTLRRAIHAGMIPCRIIGRTYLISWQNIVTWATCETGCDNPVKSVAEQNR